MSYLRKYLAEFVYGAIDGTVTTFAVIAGALGASLSPAVILILGFANLFADGFSMAVSNYLSTKSNNDLLVINSEKFPVKTAWATFVSFVVIGFIPLFSFVVAPFSSFVDSHKFIISIILTALAFFGIGWTKGIVVEKNHFSSALETLLVGGAAAVIAYSVGYFLRGVINP
ncbi:MAG: hypothetical protein A3G52_04930 [Candidatus Taylorbacteria bacterium RIFCSPLOWO2_12_FULL_43_20]|uniref:VIT family protein n=1 Tax=Candidatus Taylorbacteria bacterium RIFCSPLOWO2_12_FULL_43_20 TaxID=1802332 RepID=A0A1G2P193_9BACT|nr:MAG: hypothetical protein A2825_03400 [Candidatus Taylorbacteria bacterium RIFCSPHIGHO2_01_FULL_43_120]OHA23758.1 MAG: hypothetical protein A3B98_02925 [Candidatus Taylorbacteria bacterium RIFCSPHIGHO2_02_FULL_43_55]OHA30213.1 MAG: hypothetical protein A3E92_01320 [Candidatus Taylorbacteria bacterium RIFCSPHIGHO2_12_FULL_42_34]OHA31962.1 MAG: hypothetical protein A3B09_01080 [Candidatus Taylorbacteria bacterium RIFCSPLOWO2_01_FULL_43_83]OHA37985.1 MAG: hypothetical protein A3H58_01495 [Candi